jgi:thiamine biosynthesis lipoprotein
MSPLHHAWAWVALAALSASPGLHVATVTREAWAMGTRVRLVAEAREGAAAEAATEAALLEIERVERLLSTWDSSSQLARLNAAPEGLPVVVAGELSALLHETADWTERTGRAFDPRIGALVDAWDVRGEGRVPTDDELAGALAATGSSSLALEDDRATRGSAAAWIDSGAFGKGAALRSVARQPHAVDRLLVDLGGQLWAGAPPTMPWLVDVAHPRERTRRVARLAVHDASVATSGASERPGHLLDPRSGRPAPDWGSVTVVSADALQADVLSTSLYIMGPDQGLAWARAHAVAALFLEVTPEGLRGSWTDAMGAWLVEAPTPSRHGLTPWLLP